MVIAPFGAAFSLLPWKKTDEKDLTLEAEIDILAPFCLEQKRNLK